MQMELRKEVTYSKQLSISSPTVYWEDLLCTLIDDSRDGRDMTTFDVPGEYLHAEMENNFVDIMCKVNLEYEKHARYEHGGKVLYLLILRAIYGSIDSTLLWYQLFSTKLECLGFEIKPYDKCVSNTVI